MALFGLRLPIYLSPQVLQTDGRFCHFVPASHLGESFSNSKAPSLHRRYPASMLLQAPPSPSRLSPHFPVFPVIESTLLREISSRDEEGFSSCLACPRHRAAATTPPEQVIASARMRCPMLSSSYGGGLDLRELALSGPPVRSLSLRPGDSLTIPRMASSIGFRPLVSRRPAIQATGLLALALAGLTPAEHASLRWTHVGSRTGASVTLGATTFPAPATSNAACGFPALRFPVTFVKKIMQPIRPDRFSALVESAGPYSHHRVPVRHTTIAYSTDSSRIPFDSGRS